MLGRNALTAACSAVWQKRKGWVQTGGQVGCVMQTQGFSEDASQQNQRGASKKRGRTSGHGWVRVRELHGGLALRWWWRPQPHWVRLASSCSHWRGSLRVPPALCWLTGRKKKIYFQVWVTSPHLIHSLICELFGAFFCNNSDIQWPAGFFLGKAGTIDGLNNVKLLYLKRYWLRRPGFGFLEEFPFLKKV